jgi:hypothetical protein
MALTFIFHTKLKTDYWLRQAFSLSNVHSTCNTAAYNAGPEAVHHTCSILSFYCIYLKNQKEEKKLENLKVYILQSKLKKSLRETVVNIKKKQQLL